MEKKKYTFYEPIMIAIIIIILRKKHDARRHSHESSPHLYHTLPTNPRAHLTAPTLPPPPHPLWLQPPTYSFFSSSWHYDRQNIVRRSSRWPSSWHTSLAHTTVPLLPPPSPPPPSPYKTWTPCSGLLAQCEAAETGTWYGLMAGGADTICFEGGFGLLQIV